MNTGSHGILEESSAVNTRIHGEAADPFRENKSQLAEKIGKNIGIPVDVKAVAATIESMGLRDIDVQTDYGADTIFELAEEVNLELRRKTAASPQEEKKERFKKAMYAIGRFFKFYLKGSLFAAPMTAQIIVLFALSTSLWAWLFFNERQATIIAIGTILSFIVTAGFAQAVSRRGMFYWQQEIYRLARRISRDFMKAGITTVFISAILIYLVNLIFPFFEQDMILICIMYFILLSILWLNIAILYMLEQYAGILISTVVGGILVWVVMANMGWSIYACHVVGIVVANIVAFLWGFLILDRKATQESGIRKLAKLPRYSIIGWAVSPYFVYGILYFGFLFMDRIIGWSAPLSPNGDPPPYLIWFRTSYEVGIDLALIPFILTIAMHEYTINEFATMLKPTQERTDAFNTKTRNRSFKLFYLRQLFLLGTVAVFSIWLSVLAVNYLETLPDVPLGDSSVTSFVFRWGMVGYAFVAVGLLNSVFFMSLSRPVLVRRAIGLGLIVNVIVGFILSRTVVYYYSVFGMVAGAIVFAAVSTWIAWKVMNELDYYYYSSY